MCFLCPCFALPAHLGEVQEDRTGCLVGCRAACQLHGLPGCLTHLRLLLLLHWWLLLLLLHGLLLWVPA
jgi:hypothetical protein